MHFTGTKLTLYSDEADVLLEDRGETAQFLVLRAVACFW